MKASRIALAAVLVTALGALVFAAGALAAKPSPPPGNSGNAQKCNKGKWSTLVREDGTSFASQGECVSYGAQGGTLMPKPEKSQAQILCESYGGTFSRDASDLMEWQDEWLSEWLHGPYRLVWSCNGAAPDTLDGYLSGNPSLFYHPLAQACWGDGGVGFAGSYVPEPGIREGSTAIDTVCRARSS